jgi:hypothetical protein
MSRGRGIAAPFTLQRGPLAANGSATVSRLTNADVGVRVSSTPTMRLPHSSLTECPQPVEADISRKRRMLLLTPSRHWPAYFAVLHNTVLSMLGCGPRRGDGISSRSFAAPRRGRSPHAHSRARMRRIGVLISTEEDEVALGRVPASHAATPAFWIATPLSGSPRARTHRCACLSETSVPAA